MSDQRVTCPVCGRWVTRYVTGTLQRHKAKPKWLMSKKLHHGPVDAWCSGGGIQLGNVFENNPPEEKTPTEYEPNDIDELAKAVAFRTDLSEHICRELLQNGWRFVQELGKPDRWEKTY